jgi:CheY-like chemotaxis protein
MPTLRDGTVIYPRESRMETMKHKERKNRSLKTMVSVALIDDDENLADIVCRLCERCGGVTMHSSSSGEEALQWLSRHPVDVIVTDFQMPRMNGIELIKKIRESGNMVPCIIYSAVDMKTVIQESTIWGVGIFGYLQKDDPLRSQIVGLMELIINASTYSPRTDGDALKLWGRNPEGE